MYIYSRDLRYNKPVHWSENLDHGCRLRPLIFITNNDVLDQWFSTGVPRAILRGSGDFSGIFIFILS